MNQSGTTTAKNTGTYTVTWSLKDTGNTTWSDNSTGNKSANWSINWVNGQSHYSNDIYNRGWGSGTFSYRCTYYGTPNHLQDQGITYHDDCVEYWASIKRDEHDNNYITCLLQNSAVNQDNIKKIHVEYKADLGGRLTSPSGSRKYGGYTIPTTSSKYYSDDTTMGKGYIYNMFGLVWLQTRLSDMNYHVYIYRIWFE